MYIKTVTLRVEIVESKIYSVFTVEEVDAFVHTMTEESSTIVGPADIVTTKDNASDPNELTFELYYSDAPNTVETTATVFIHQVLLEHIPMLMLLP